MSDAKGAYITNARTGSIGRRKVPARAGVAAEDRIEREKKKGGRGPSLSKIVSRPNQKLKVNPTVGTRMFIS